MHIYRAHGGEPLASADFQMRDDERQPLIKAVRAFNKWETAPVFVELVEVLA